LYFYTQKSKAAPSISDLAHRRSLYAGEDQVFN
jgi:hypothetical protein